MKNRYIIVLTMPILLIFFTNMDRVSTSNELTVQQIADEINTTIERAEAGEFGEKGVEALLMFQLKNLNYLAVKSKVRSCNELRKLVPKIPTAYYMINNGSTEDMLYCRSSVDFIESAYKWLRNKKPSYGGLSKWLNVMSEKGIIGVVTGISEQRQSQTNALSNYELAKAIFKVLRGTDASDSTVSYWKDRIVDVGIAKMVLELATEDESIKANISFFDAVKSALKKPYTSGHVHLKGWVCIPNSTKTLTVDIYSDSKSRPGTVMEHLGTVQANRSSKGSTSQECGTQGIAHDFKLSVPQSRFKYNGRVARYYFFDPYNEVKIFLNRDKVIHLPRKDD